MGGRWKEEGFTETTADEANNTKDVGISNLILGSLLMV